MPLTCSTRSKSWKISPETVGAIVGVGVKDFHEQAHCRRGEGGVLFAACGMGADPPVRGEGCGVSD